jgi:hypothetical protein
MADQIFANSRKARQPRDSTLSVEVGLGLKAIEGPGNHIRTLIVSADDDAEALRNKVLRKMTIEYAGCHEDEHKEQIVRSSFC